MTTEEVAACTGVTLRQLRHWNKLGLVGPKPRGQGVALKWSFPMPSRSRSSASCDPSVSHSRDALESSHPFPPDRWQRSSSS